MKTHSQRAIAIEVVLIAVAVLGATGWFGVRQIKKSIEEYKQQQAVKKADIEAAKSQAAAEAALAERNKAEAAALEAKKAREAERAKEVEVGRTIQRSSIEGSIAVEQLPTSKQRENLIQRFSEIDSAAGGLYGTPPGPDLALWKQRALDALAGQAAAQAELDKQKVEIEQLKSDLGTQRELRAQAEKRFEDANGKANKAQVQATSEAARARAEADKATEAVMNGNAASDLFQGVLKILAVIAGCWVLAVVMKLVSFNIAPDTAVGKLVHGAANAFHFLAAPAGLFAEHQAKTETNQIVESTGTALADLRREMPAIASQVTPVMDIAFSPQHQRKVHAAFLAAEREHAASAAETRARVMTAPSVGRVESIRVPNVAEVGAVPAMPEDPKKN